MLTKLSISNFALIDKLEVSFSNGMTSITGETGAGKSIILGALSLVLGNRATSSLIKEPSKKCIVEAIFQISSYNLIEFFKTNNLDFDSETILRREIIPNGKSRAFINDTPVTLEILGDLSTYLIDIHSQNENHIIFLTSYQFKILDLFAGNEKMVKEYKDEFLSYKQLLFQLKKIESNSINLSKEMEYNNFLYDELKTLNLFPEILENLENQVNELSNIEDLKLNLSKSQDLISNEEYGIIDKLSLLKSTLKKNQAISNKFDGYSSRVESLIIELQDIYNDFARKDDLLELDPNLLENKNNQLNKLNSILKKHKVSNIEDLMKIENNLKLLLFDTENINQKIDETKKIINEKKQFLLKLANQIHKKRLNIIPKLEKKLKSIVLKMGMKNSNFKLKLEENEDLTIDGKHKLDFLFSSNLGSKYSNIKRVASGGELSRIILALKSLLSKYHRLPTIIFDEIDSGVSGIIANEIGILMKEMAKSMQVLTITHIPQVAAKGTNQFKVYKTTNGKTTETYLKQLNDRERVDEIGLMLSGNQITTTALNHARELLD